MKKKEITEEYIVIVLFVLMALHLLFDCRLETVTIGKICGDWNARKFLSQIAEIPQYRTERHALAYSCYGLQCLITLLRKRISEIPVGFRYLISLLYVGACIIMMLSVNDVQSILILSFLVCLLTFFRDKHRWIWIALLTALFILLGSDFFESLFIRFSVSNYIEYYNSDRQIVLFGVHSLICSSLVVAIVGYLLVNLRIRTSENLTISKMNELLTETTQELQESNRALKDYSEKVEELSKTQERNRIAREIHDTLGHTLTGIATSIEVCQELTKDDNETVRKYLNASREMALSGLEDVRRSLNELRPDLIEKSDLDTALRIMIDRFSNAQKVSIKYSYTGDASGFSDDEKETIFRIVQESMTNSVRHGHCENIRVELEVIQDRAEVTVTDDGVNSGEIVPGFGIHHMQERAEMLGGTVNVMPGEQCGTEVHATVPIRRNEKDDTGFDS